MVGIPDLTTWEAAWKALPLWTVEDLGELKDGGCFRDRERGICKYG